MIGTCNCGTVTFEVCQSFLYVHCCHCSWCQRETGSGFAINGLVETRHIKVLTGAPKQLDIQSNSGAGQSLVQCSNCQTTLWSHYSSAKEVIAFVRVGTLYDAATVDPDIHIYTSTKLPWVTLPDGANIVTEYYRRSAYWPSQSIQRYKEALASPAITKDR